MTNDTATPFRGSVSWALVTMNGRKLAGGRRPEVGRALADTLVADLDLDKEVSRAGARRVAVVFALKDEKGRRVRPEGARPRPPSGGRVSGGAVYFVPSKHLELADPLISLAVRGVKDRWEVSLKAGCLARFVEISAGTKPRIWDDNYFDLASGEKRVVSCPRLPGEGAAAFKRALRVYSLYEAGGLR